MLDIDFEHDQMETGRTIWADRLLDLFLLDPRFHTAWKFWRASHPVNMGDALRFSVDGSKHTGYVTIHYGGGCDPVDVYGLGLDSFNIEFGVCEGTAYRQVEMMEGVHRRELARTISLRVL